MAKTNHINDGKMYKICERHAPIAPLKLADVINNCFNCPDCRCMGDASKVSYDDLAADTANDPDADENDLDGRVTAAKIT